MNANSSPQQVEKQPVVSMDVRSRLKRLVTKKASHHRSALTLAKTADVSNTDLCKLFEKDGKDYQTIASDDVVEEPSMILDTDRSAQLKVSMIR